MMRSSYFTVFRNAFACRVEFLSAYHACVQVSVVVRVFPDAVVLICIHVFNDINFIWFQAVFNRVFIMENKNPRLFSRGFIITFRHWHVPPCFHGFMMPACFAYAPIYLSNPFHCVVCVCSELFCFNASNCVFIESN